MQKHLEQTGSRRYLLTSAGIKSRTALTRAYLARKEAEYKALKAEIQTLRKIEGTMTEDVASAGGERG